jgi:diaminopimelate decarboxylase
LWLEPGRFIVGNAAVLLARVGAVKRDLGLTWVNLDASTNNLMRIDTSHSIHYVFPAAGMNREAVEHAIVVGETCIDSVFSPDCLVPPLERGEPIAILDAGMYAETASTQLNGIPRPATVLVSGSSSDMVKERETVGDVFSKHRIPDRLR